MVARHRTDWSRKFITRGAPRRVEHDDPIRCDTVTFGRRCVVREEATTYINDMWERRRQCVLLRSDGANDDRSVDAQRNE